MIIKENILRSKDIMDKEKTLRHMLKPNTWKQIKDMILDAGFQDVQCFWSNHMFVGVIGVKIKEIIWIRFFKRCY